MTSQLCIYLQPADTGADLVTPSEPLQRVAQVEEEAAVDDARLVGGDSFTHQLHGLVRPVVGRLDDKAQVYFGEAILGLQAQHLSIKCDTCHSNVTPVNQKAVMPNTLQGEHSYSIQE